MVTTTRVTNVCTVSQKTVPAAAVVILDELDAACTIKRCLASG